VTLGGKETMEQPETIDAEKRASGSLERLVRAVWAAGWRAGHDSGSDAATSYEWGSRSQKPQDPEKAWAEDVQWRIDAESSYKLDIENPEAWRDAP
jgi:hypothetical protein